MTATLVSLAPVSEALPERIGHIGLAYEREIRTVWARIHWTGRQVFSRQVLGDMAIARQTVRDWAKATGSQVRYVVLTSAEGKFGVGGDLEYFAQAIANKDRAGLTEYAHSCIANCWDFQQGLGIPAVTISLIKGIALGGALEAALSAHHVVAEAGVHTYFPEAVMGLFPGMGAQSFLRRRVTRRQAEELILGKFQTSDELYEIGAIDQLVPQQNSEDAVRAMIADFEERCLHRPLLAVKLGWNGAMPLTLEELQVTTDAWVDTAMQIDPAHLKFMSRIAQRQMRNAGAI